MGPVLRPRPTLAKLLRRTADRLHPVPRPLPEISTPFTVGHTLPAEPAGLNEPTEPGYVSPEMVGFGSTRFHVS